MRMSDISRFVYTNLLSEMSENEHLVYQQVTKSVLSALILNKHFLNIADVINNPLFLLDEDTNLIAYENVADNDVNLMNFVTHNESYRPFQRNLKKMILLIFTRNTLSRHSVQVSKKRKE